MFNGRPGIRPAAVNPTSVACHDLMDACGVSFPEAHLDPQAMATLALAGHEIAGFDSVMPEFSVHQESAAFGCTMDWGHRDKMPDAQNAPHADFSDVIIPSDFMEKPSIRVVLDALSILRRKVGGKAAIIGKVMGPWTMGYHMAGTQNFLLQLGLGETEQISKMLKQLAPITVAFAKAQFQAGADIVVVADHATGNLIGSYHYRELLLPVHKEITSQIGGPLILHVCGNCYDRLEYFAEAGFDAYHFESSVNAKDALAKLADTGMSLVGNINNPQTLFQGTPEDVYKQAREAIKSGIRMIGPECAIPLATPLANLQAIAKACKEGY